MAEGPPVDTDPDFEPLSRPRSCTWPLPRPELTDPAGSDTSSPALSVHKEPAGGNTEFSSSSLGLLEEDYAEYTERKPPFFPCQERSCTHLHPHHPHNPPPPPHHLQLPPQQQVSPSGVPALGGSGQRKISSSRRNAWGNMSYADLITKAIDSSPEKRLTLSQIYDWMVKSVPYFKDKGDSNSSAGWKNSIRHNLSLHSRFVRIQNEGTGKSSWWMLNPDGAKSGKSPRRRAASMDNNNKFVKSRGRASKKKMSLQEEAEGGGASPRSQYWLGSPNSHSNEDFEAWGSFRTRTSSDASTLSGRHSPFPSEQEDLVESDGLMLYPGAPGTKKTSALPRLSEVTGPMVPCVSEHMESLLDNLHLLSPKAPQLGSDPSQSSNAAVLQSSSYGSAGLTQDYHKCSYGQVRLALPETKPGFRVYENQYISPAGLLQELLTTDADPSRNLMSSSDTRGPDVGRTNCLMSTYSGPSPVGGHKMISPPQSHPGLHVNPQSMHSQGPAPSRDLNICDMIPLTSLTSLSGAPQRVTRPQPARGHPAHANGFPASFSTSYRELNSLYTHHHHHHHHHQERLPSDLDNMSIERLDCDMDSVLHDTLMDGGGLDFNFDPTAGSHGFPQRVKTTSHNWVSG